MNNSVIITIILVIVVGAGAFFAGTKYQAGKQQQNFRSQTGRFGQGQGNGMMGRQGFRPVTGEILSVGDNNITVKMPDGSSRIVVVSESTAINKASQGAKSDLKAGETVMVFGQQNSDGSVTAQNIQLNPPNRPNAPASP